MTDEQRQVLADVLRDKSQALHPYAITAEALDAVVLVGAVGEMLAGFERGRISLRDAGFDIGADDYPEMVRHLRYWASQIAGVYPNRRDEPE
jgi:hypothetical protein